MCFDDGTTYRSRTYEACSDSYHDEVVLAPRPVRRYGPRRTYYPSSYYTRPPCGRLLNSGYYGGRYGSRNVVPGGYGYGGGNYLAGGRVPMPSNSAMRSYYYTSGVAAAPAYSYAYPATTTTTVLQPAATTYTVTNGTVPVTTTASVAAPRVPTRDEIQNENVRIAIQRGATNARRIKPADALPDDPFWCKERNGEWHLRSFYQIENECQPGLWKINAESGMLTFERL